MSQYYGGKDFIYGVLASDCTINATTLTVQSLGEGNALGAYSQGAVLTIGTESIICTSNNGAALTVTRGAGGTTPAAHYAGDVVRLAASFVYIAQITAKLAELELALHSMRDRTDGVLRKSSATSAATLPLKVVAQGSPNLTVAVNDGLALIAGDVQNGSSASIAIPAPVTHPRIDVIQLTLDTGANRVAGTEAASPSAPAVSANSIPLATVHCRVGMTSVKNTDDTTNGYITDARAFI
jgi:hypothetical protein